MNGWTEIFPLILDYRISFLLRLLPKSVIKIMKYANKSGSSAEVCKDISGLNELRHSDELLDIGCTIPYHHIRT